MTAAAASPGAGVASRTDITCGIGPTGAKPAWKIACFSVTTTIGWYTKGLPGSAELRNKVNQQDDPAIVVAMLREFYSPWLCKVAA